ncbi:hypothetical protein KXV29_009094 [Aspergillus fumigatus]|nr:hypothetical protein KXX43_008765 [Aspergillus fumigatus]KAH2344847.1 hypothetical protein KXV29_009094 [Aspergillus fumigatus]KAH2615029.1 hypothetical protein KXW34_006734 [Aspergillus fumigatus]KAJ8193575.1 hypothetical protein LV161_003130 [Aspergillus fumigatus]
MLDCATSAQKQGNSRSFELALRAARTCMDQGQLNLSQKIISVAATRLNNMSQNKSSHYRAKVEAYTTEYYMLRIYLTCLQGRSDIGEHLFSKVPQASRGGSQETVMDICYRVGAQAISCRQLDVAAQWLERALSSSELQGQTQQIDPDLKDKRFRVLLALAWVGLHLDTADAKRCLDRVVASLKSEYDNNFEAQIFQLEIFRRKDISDYDEYSEILRRAIAALELNDAALQTILYFILKLKESGHLEECKTSASTLYVLYGAALRSGDYTLGQICLRSLTELEQEGKIYLLSCAAEARRSGNTRFTIKCLQQLIVGMDDDSLGEVPGSTLFHDNAASIAHLISTFEEALKHANNEGRLPRYAASELEWFARKSYNIALDIDKTSPSETVLRLLDISLEFTDLYHKKTETKDRVFLYLMGEYVKSNKLVAEARGHTPSSVKVYKQIRRSVQRFEAYIQIELDTCNTTSERGRWTHKYRLLLALDFEAAINLKHWNDIPSIIDRASNMLDDKLCSAFLDCILRSGAPASNIAQVVKSIICSFHSSPSPSFSAGAFLQKLPRYLRCLFQIALEAKDYSLAESVLHQAIVLARDGSADADLPFLYPSDELKWLASMAFNRAVDLYVASVDEDCRKWGDIAITLADLIRDDGGALLRLLRQNYAKLM